MFRNIVYIFSATNKVKCMIKNGLIFPQNQSLSIENQLKVGENSLLKTLLECTFL